MGPLLLTDNQTFSLSHYTRQNEEGFSLTIQHSNLAINVKLFSIFSKMQLFLIPAAFLFTLFICKFFCRV
jgi:hypothetical protein